MAEDVAQCVFVFGLGLQCRQTKGERHIGLNRGQRAPQRQKVEMGAQVLAGHAFHFSGMGNHAIEIAVGLQPFGGSLGADFLDARDVVGRITDQRQVIGNARRRHAEFGLDTGHVEPLVAHGIDQGDLRCDQLCQIFVASGDHNV